MADQPTRTQLIEQKIDKTTTGSMVPVAPGGAVRFVPQDMNQALEFAKLMAVSDKAVRKHLRNNPGACLAVAMQATEWSMNPFAVANKTYEVNDQLAFESQLVNAVINTRAPLQRRLRISYEGEGVALRCKVTGWLIGEEQPFEYETPPFANINPKNSPVWQTDPKRQIAYYATRNWARLYCPEIILGVVTDDEMEDARRVANARDITPEVDKLPPPRPTADNRGDPAEADRARAEREADLPREFTIWDAQGEIVAENLGPRAYTERMLQELANVAKDGHLGIFETFAENNTDEIRRLYEINFQEQAHAISNDISVYMKKLDTKPAATPAPVQAADVSDGANQGTSAPSEAGNTTVIEQEPDPVQEEPTEETPPSGPENEPVEGNGDEGQQATETESTGPGAEESSAGAGSKEPPAEFIYIDTAGRSRFYSDPTIWRTFVMKGLNHPKVTPDLIRKVRDQNQQLFADMTAWGGKYAEEVAVVEKAIAEKLA